MKTYYFITPRSMHIIKVNDAGIIDITYPTESILSGQNFKEIIKLSFKMCYNCKTSLYECK